jgi:hypothetical protein
MSEMRFVERGGKSYQMQTAAIGRRAAGSEGDAGRRVEELRREAAEERETREARRETPPALRARGRELVAAKRSRGRAVGGTDGAAPAETATAELARAHAEGAEACDGGGLTPLQHVRPWLVRLSPSERAEVRTILDRLDALAPE